VIGQYAKDIKKEFSEYDSHSLSCDIVAAVQVAALSFPLSLAYGMSTGLGVLSGILSALIAGIIIAFFSGTRLQISAPTGAMCAILITISSQYGIKGILFSGLLSGIILILASLFHIGRLISFIPSPVFTGFTSGIALVFAIGQIDNFFGTHSTGTNIIEKFMSYGHLGFSPNLIAMMFGFLTIAIMMFWPKSFKNTVPSALGAIAAALLINLIFNMDVPEVGYITRGFFAKNALSFSDISFQSIVPYFFPALSIAALCLMQSSVGGAYLAKKTEEKFRQERELIAQGIGNLILPFFGAVPVTADFSYSRINLQSGAKTRLSSMFQAIFLFVIFLALSPVLSHIPLSALAGVLVVTAFRMNDWKSIRFIFKKRFATSMVQFFVTMLLTVFVDLTFAIVIGIVVSIFIFVARNCDLKVEISDVDTGRLHDVELANDYTQTKLVYLTGPLFFGTQDRLLRALSSLDNTSHVILSMRGVPSMDQSAVYVLEDILEDYESRNIHLMCCGVQPVVKTVLDRSELTDKIGENNFFWDAIAAIKTLK